jgi:hypothetical protein
MTGERIVPVLLDSADPDSCERHRAALATLPAYYSLSEVAAGAVAVVSSANEDWAKRAIGHLEAGAAALLVSIGEYLDIPGLNAVEKAARSAGALVAADLEYAADPAWTSLAAAVRQDTMGLIDGLAVTAGPVRAAALRLLITVAAAVPVLPSFQLLVAAPGQLVLGSTDGPVPVTVAAVRGADEDGQRLDMVSREVRYEISWPGRPRAAPAVCYTHRLAGTTRAALRYEAPERGMWRWLHAGLADGGPGPGLGSLRAVLESVPFSSPAALE